MFNTNTFHNILNVLIALSASMIAILLATGCTQLADGTLECPSPSLAQALLQPL